MAQLKITKHDKPADQVRANTNRLADAANEVAESRERGRQAVDSMAETVERQANAGIAASERLTETTGDRLEAASRGGTDLAAFWLETMQEQTIQNVEAMQKIAAAQDWQDKVAIQTEFFSASLSRLQTIFARYMAMTGTLPNVVDETEMARAKKTIKAA